MAGVYGSRKQKLTLGLRFSAVDAFEGKPTKALTIFFSLSGAPSRNSVRIRSCAKICLILCGLRSNSRRSFLRGSASGCHSPPPFSVSDCLIQPAMEEWARQQRKVNNNAQVAGAGLANVYDLTYLQNYLHLAESGHSKRHRGLCDPFSTKPRRSRSNG